MGGVILGVSTLYRLFCFFKLFLMVGKGLTDMAISSPSLDSCIARKMIKMAKPEQSNQYLTVVGYVLSYGIKQNICGLLRS